MKRYLKWLVPLLVCAAIAPFTPAIDLAIARHFFSEGTFYENGFTAFLYRYGEITAFFFGGAATLLFLLSSMKPTWKKWRQPALVLTLTFILGAGVIVHAVFKEHWGRPRPKHLVEFGGADSFRPFWSPNFNTEEPKKSFPSGHVAVGFYYLALCLVGRRIGSRALILTGICLTVFFGFGLFFARLAKGGHFFSDALFSVLIMWLSALFSEWLAYNYLPKTKYSQFLI